MSADWALLLMTVIVGAVLLYAGYKQWRLPPRDAPKLPSRPSVKAALKVYTIYEIREVAVCRQVKHKAAAVDEAQALSFVQLGLSAECDVGECLERRLLRRSLSIGGFDAAARAMLDDNQDRVARARAEEEIG